MRPEPADATAALMIDLRPVLPAGVEEVGSIPDIASVVDFNAWKIWSWC